MLLLAQRVEDGHEYIAFVAFEWEMNDGVAEKVAAAQRGVPTLGKDGMLLNLVIGGDGWDLRVDFALPLMRSPNIPCYLCHSARGYSRH